MGTGPGVYILFSLFIDAFKKLDLASHYLNRERMHLPGVLRAERSVPVVSVLWT